MKKLKVVWRDRSFEGIETEGSDKDTLVLKLPSGYNVSIPREEARIEQEEEVATEKKEEGQTHGGEVAVLGFGGTISSRVDYETGGVSPRISASELAKEFPEIREISTISVKQVLAKFSEEMQPEDWELMAEEVFSNLKEHEGVVVLHGTDTMGYSSAALSFSIRSPKPIVFVGAQRSSDRPSSDNKINLLNAIYSAKKRFGEVVVCMHEGSSDGFCLLHTGTKVRKMHSSRRDAFKTINSMPLARVNWKGNYFSFLRQPRSSERLELHNGFHDNVALIYVHPGMKQSFFRKLSDYDGIVLAGTGLGHLAVDKLEEEIRELISSGVYIYMTTQTIYGRTNLNVYSTGRRLLSLGVDGNYNDMLPETAFVKLCWAMKREKNREKISELMKTNIAGELSERTIE